MAEQQLEALPYFHGFLDTADLPEFLKTNGDFLCRYSLSATVNQKRSYVISVVVIKGDDKSKENKVIRSYSPVKKEDGSLTLDNLHSMPTFFDLIQYHLKSQKPISDTDVLLLTPVHRKRWEFRPGDIEMDKPLGEGRYGGVSRGSMKYGKHKMLVAVKYLKIDSSAEMPNDSLAQILSEARMMRKVSGHNNVVKFLGASLDKEPILIAMELVDGCDMAKALRSQKVPEECRLPLVIGAAHGLAYVHSRGLIHRDVAARNCLINTECTVVRYFSLSPAQYRLKLCDFGLSRLGPNYDVKQVRAIPFKWMAPECLKTRAFTYKTDVWAFGVTVWEVFTNGLNPYTGLSSAETRTQLLDKKEPLRFAKQGRIHVPPELVELIEDQVFDFDPQRRITMKTLTEKLETIATEQPATVQLRCLAFTQQAKEEKTTSQPKTDGTETPSNFRGRNLPNKKSGEKSSEDRSGDRRRRAKKTDGGSNCRWKTKPAASPSK